MIEEYKAGILGPVDMSAVASKVSTLIEGDTRIGRWEIDELFQVSDRVLLSVPEKTTVRELLQYPRFTNAVTRVDWQAEAKKIRRQAKLVLDQYGYAIMEIQARLLQTGISVADYERIATFARATRSDVASVVEGAIHEMLREICPELEWDWELEAPNHQ